MKRAFYSLLLFSCLFFSAIFSACDNKNPDPVSPAPVTVVLVVTPTWTGTNTPCGFPGNTCTFTVTDSPTPTFTATSTNTPVTILLTPTPVTVPGRDWTYSTLNAGFAPRQGHLSLVFDNKMWVIGGFYVESGPGLTHFNDVWYSSDVSNWVQALSDAATPGPNQISPIGASGVVFNNAMWVIGGPSNDVWTSSNGVSWSNVLSAASTPGPNQFPGRTGHTSLVYNNKIWVIGGNGGPIYRNDVWFSSDGVAWTNALADTDSPGPSQFPKRASHTSLVYNNKMWVMGGWDGTHTLNDVWSSADGVNWTQVLPDSAGNFFGGFPRRANLSSLVYDGAMWVIAGGNESAILNDVWYSTTGDSWTQITSAATFPKRESHSAFVFDGKMWVVGGLKGPELNDVWHSPY